MAVALEFIDFIVPIELFKAKYSGGWERCVREHTDLIGGRVWYDEYLFRDGAMGPADIEALVTKWTDLGFEPMTTAAGQRAWKDCCVTERMFGGPTLPCGWIEITESGEAAFLKGTKPEKIVGGGIE